MAAGHVAALLAQVRGIIVDGLGTGEFSSADPDATPPNGGAPRPVPH